MTVCINGTCPFEDCSYHPIKLRSSGCAQPDFGRYNQNKGTG